MTTPDTAIEIRRCIGSKTFGIEAHDAPIADFPVQPSQKDGLGRMCKTHWTQYTGALRKAALARKAEPAAAIEPAPPTTPADDPDADLDAVILPAGSLPPERPLRTTKRRRAKPASATAETANLQDALEPALAGKSRRTRKAVAAALAPADLVEAIDSGTEEADVAIAG